MLDIKVLREDVEKVIERLNTRGGDFSYLREVVELDEKRRVELKKVEDLKSFRNEKSKKILSWKRPDNSNCSASHRISFSLL